MSISLFYHVSYNYSPELSKAVALNRELQLFLIQTRPSLHWLSRKHSPSFALQGLVFEQILRSIRPEKKFFGWTHPISVTEFCRNININYDYLWKLQLQQPGQENIQRIKLSPSCPVNHMVWLICRESTFLKFLWICNSH